MTRLPLLVLCSFAVCSAQQYVISRVAGGGALTTSIPGTEMPLTPAGFVIDANNNLYFTSGNVVYKLDSNANLLTRIAGRSPAGFSGDGGSALDAQLNLNFPVTTPIPVNGPQSPPIGLALDSSGNLFIADFGNSRIRRVSPDGVITTVAGTGSTGFSGDNGPAVSAQLNWPEGLVFDSAGNLFVADTYNNRIRKISPQGIITTVAGTGVFGSSGDGGPASRAALYNPGSLIFDSVGNLYDAEPNALRVIGRDGVINSVAKLLSEGGLAIDSKGDLYVSDWAYGSVEILSPSGTNVGYVGASGAQFSNPLGLAIDSSGSLLIANFGRGQIDKVDSSGNFTTIAGIPRLGGPEEDGVPAVKTQLDPQAIATDGQGDLFISEPLEQRIRKVSNGVISTVVGGNSSVAATPGAIAASSKGDLFYADSTAIRRLSSSGSVTDVLATPFRSILALAIDFTSNLFLSEANDIRKVSPDGTATVVAGMGGPAGTTQLGQPGALATDSNGNLFIAANNGIWKLTTAGAMTQLATSSFGVVSALACDPSGNLYVATESKEIIQVISPGGQVTTIAGTGQFGSTGDGGIATSAQLWNPVGLALDGASNIYISDNGEGEIRRLSPTSTPVIISAVVDAAREQSEPLSPGKIVAIYGAGLGPANIAINQPANGAFGTQVAGTNVTFNGIPAAMYYASADQAAAVVPYEVSGALSAQVVVTSASGISQPFTVEIAPSGPAFFTANASGSGQLAAQNHDYTLNDAAHPAAIGSYIILYATGEGQLTPTGVDGQLASVPYPKPVLPIRVTIGGIPVTPAYAGSAPTEIEGLMQINVQIPAGVQPGGYVPVSLQVGNASNTAETTWISVSQN